VDGTLFNAIIHRCYRGSAAASTAAAASLGFHRILRTFQRRVAAYVVLSQFAKGVMVRGGLPADKIYVRPNFLIDPPDVGHSAREGFLYVGRLSAEKGIGTLLRAWTELSSSPSRPFLHIVGDGPLREIVRAHVEKYGLAAELLPREDRESIMRRMRSSRAVIIPSEWYEGFPLVAVEALAAGAPIIASRLGSLEEIVVNGENGWHFEPGDPRDLVRVVSDVALQDDAENMSRNSRSSFDENYTSEHAFKKLMEIYSAVGAQ
jgi:glycosyltransferase involved in cell wall biosynthesis